MTKFTFIEELEAELEEIHEKNCSSIYRGVKNAPLLGRCRLEIKKRDQLIADLAEENCALLIVCEQGYALTKAIRLAWRTGNLETRRKARKALDDYERALAIAFTREVE